MTTAETTTIVASDEGLYGNASSSLIVNPGALDHFSISTITSPQTAGTAITDITLTAQDENNNTVTSFSGGGNKVIYSGTAGITGTSAAFSSGVLSGVSVTPTVAGSSMTFIITGATKTGSSTFDVNPGELDYFSISTISSPQTAGTAITGITLTAQDAYNNTVTDFTSTVAFSGTAGITGTSEAFTSGQLTDVSVTPTVAGSSMTFIITGATKTGNSTFDVNPGALDHFSISTISSPQTSGTAITGITLTAQDANNNTITSFSGGGNTVTYSGTAGITGTSAEFTSGVLSGVSVTPTVAGSSLTFIVTASGKTGTSTFDVNPGSLNHFAISTITSPQTAGTAITGITLTAQDASNNTVTGFTSTVTYSGTAGITGTSAAFSSGVLSDVSVTPTLAGSGKTFIVTGATKTGTSTFDVNPGTQTKLVITLPGETFTAGSGNSGTVTVQTAGTSFNIVSITATDAYFNIVTSYSGAKTIAYSGPGSGLNAPSYTTAVSFTNGQSTTILSTTLTKAETTTLTAKDGGLYGNASSSLTVNPGALDHFAISSITSPQTAGTAITGINFIAQDANNNTVTSFSGGGNTVTYSGTAGITGTSAAFTSGQLTGVSVTPITAGSSMTFIITGATKTGTSTFDVNPGALDHFAISTITSPPDGRHGHHGYHANGAGCEQQHCNEFHQHSDL